MLIVIGLGWKGITCHIFRNSPKSWVYTFKCLEAVSKRVWFIRSLDIILSWEEGMGEKNQDCCLREKNITCFQLPETEMGI